MTRVAGLVALAIAASGCSRRSDPGQASSASAAPSAVPAPIASGVPLDPQAVSRAVNPDGKPAYSGPVGTVEGRIVATGDAPVEQPEIARQIPDKCRAARPFYAKLFREGADRALADVLVGVTGYHEYVPAREPAKRFVAKNCTFDTRTIALTYGQRIEVVSGDSETYIPELMGERGQAQIVATPGGEVASMLYPTKSGRFVLIDNLRLFMTAEVLVLKYATIAVTGNDGRYRIAGVPPGDLRLSAVLPATGATVERAVKVEGGKTVTLDLEIPFDDKAYRKALSSQRTTLGIDADSGVAMDAGAKDASPQPSARPGPKTPKPSASAKP